MKKSMLLVLQLILFGQICFSQLNEDPDIRLRGDQKVPQVMLVGTFHFGYPGLDGHKTAEKYKLDILSDGRQKELRELLDYIKVFRPTKIMLESGSNTGYLMYRLRKWKKGESKLKRNERDQIGIRLVDELGLDTIYGVDASSLSYQMSKSEDSLCYEKLFEQIYGEEETEGPENSFEQRYWDWYDYTDVKTYEMNLLDYFKYMNSEKYIKRMHGHYILSNSSDDYDGMDGLLLNWYSRNLRIFKNIQKVETTPEDRILILFGAGHIAILMQQFESSPEYQLIPFGGQP